jgi:hypothetical protein
MGLTLMTTNKTPKSAIKNRGCLESEKNKHHNYVTKTPLPAWRYHKDYQLRIFSRERLTTNYDLKLQTLSCPEMA